MDKNNKLNNVEILEIFFGEPDGEEISHERVEEINKLLTESYEKYKDNKGKRYSSEEVFSHMDALIKCQTEGKKFE